MLALEDHTDYLLNAAINTCHTNTARYFFFLLKLDKAIRKVTIHSASQGGLGIGGDAIPPGAGRSSPTSLAHGELASVRGPRLYSVSVHTLTS